ncbi:MAG: LysE family translocator [Hyphomicrobiales bacterium]
MQFLLPLIVFATVASFTPGPNTIMLAASGANYGFRPTMPHILGVQFGLPVMLLALGMGFGQVFHIFPEIHLYLKWAGTACILYFAWKISTTSSVKNGEKAGSPLTFMQAAIFQWLNPKAWVMGLGAITAYTTVGGDTFFETGLIALVFALIVFPACAAWCLFGTAIARFLTSPWRLKVFNTSMALLLAGSVILLYI